MACNPPMAFFLIGLLLFAAANPLAQAQVGINIGVNVTGRICCTLLPRPANCPGRGLAGVLVRLNISNVLGIQNTLGQNTTNANGSFTINTNIVYTPLSSVSIVARILEAAATAIIVRPIPNCIPLSIIPGNLTSPIKVVNTTITSTGTALSATIVGFSSQN